MVPDVKMGLFPQDDDDDDDDDIQKDLNFYKPIHIYSMQMVWRQVTMILEMCFVCKEKITPKNVGLCRWESRASLQENLRKKYLNLTDADGNARNALLVAW